VLNHAPTRPCSSPPLYVRKVSGAENESSLANISPLSENARSASRSETRMINSGDVIKKRQKTMVTLHSLMYIWPAEYDCFSAHSTLLLHT